MNIKYKKIWQQCLLFILIKLQIFMIFLARTAEFNQIYIKMNKKIKEYKENIQYMMVYLYILENLFFQKWKNF
jgi:hypothetical protein